MPYRETGRICLFYEDVGSVAPPILLLHELGGSSESWQAALPCLMRHRRVLAPDLRCAGRSEKPVEPFALEDAADDVAALLEALAVPAVDVLGSALGSLVGTLLALRHPARVRRLVLAAVAPEMAGETRAYLTQRSERVRREGMRSVAEASLANSFPDAHAAARAAYRPIYLANDPSGYAELALALARLDMTRADWSRITVPTLVAVGAHDFIWPPALGEQVAAAIPDARFTLLSEAGHFPHLQTPHVVATAALGFFGVSGSGSRECSGCRRAGSATG